MGVESPHGHCIGFCGYSLSLSRAQLARKKIVQSNKRSERKKTRRKTTEYINFLLKVGRRLANINLVQPASFFLLLNAIRFMCKIHGLEKFCLTQSMF